MRKNRKALLFLFLTLLSLPALARLGGGESFSSGSSSSGGGDDIIGSIIGFIIEIIFQLWFDFVVAYPAIGVPLTLLIAARIVYAVYFAPPATVSQVATRYDDIPTASPPSTVGAMSSLKQADPNFSKPLFLDFITLLYTRVRLEAGDGTGSMSGLAGYLTPKTLAGVRKEAATGAVERVIVGAIRLQEINVGSKLSSIAVRLETNLRRTRGATKEDLYQVEIWTFEREAGVLSKGPDELLKLACPSCGSPGELRSDGTCPYCGNVVNSGKFNWVVSSIQTLQSQPVVSLGLSTGGEERGYTWPTSPASDLSLQRRALEARDPSFAWDAFEQRVRYIFLRLQQAWSDRDAEAIRPYETDSLFSSHLYWIEAYLAQGLQNKLENVVLERLEVVKVEPDAYFESITVRLWAQMKDSTVDASGIVVAGDPNVARKFSECWTCIRRIGKHALKDAPPVDRCPSCGAPLDKVGMTGICGYCNTKITRGDFDWVLSQIEQPEVFVA